MDNLTNQEMVLNFGPQHPSTHGVLRVLVKLDGEYVSSAQLHYGYLHRGIEKLAESKTYDQFVPVVDRLDYLTSFSNECAYVMAVEKMLGVEVPLRAQYIRVILVELNRIASHLLWLGALGLDLGAITPVMYTLRERETVTDLMEMVSGARLTFNFFRIGGVKQDLPAGFKETARRYLENEYFQKIKDYDVLLKNNRIFLARTKDIGIVSPEMAHNYGLTGPSLRGSGVPFDLRKNQPYLVYDQLDFDIPTGEVGDVYDRYMVRIEELRQSARIVLQALEKMPEGDIVSGDSRVFRGRKDKIFNNMESLIQYCYVAMEGISVPRGEAYTKIEGPRGEIGFYIISEGNSMPYRMFLRMPTFVNLTIVQKLICGRLLADLPAILGSFDLVMGEVDK